MKWNKFVLKSEILANEKKKHVVEINEYVHYANHILVISI